MTSKKEEEYLSNPKAQAPRESILTKKRGKKIRRQKCREVIRSLGRVGLAPSKTTPATQSSRSDNPSVCDLE